MEKHFSTLFHSGEVFQLDVDVLHIKYNKGKSVTVKDIIETIAIRKKLIGEKRYYPILDMTEGIRSASNNAKAWMSVNKEFAKIRFLDIILVKGFFAKIKVKLYLSFYSPMNETVVVKSIEEALDLIAKDKKKRKLN